MTINNIRYAELGKIAFDVNGTTVKIAEPRDVLLVGVNQDAAIRWIQKRYGYLLAQIGGD
jgi:hypothetical protein